MSSAAGSIACRWPRSRPRSGNLAAGSGVDAAAAVLALHHNMIPGARQHRQNPRRRQPEPVRQAPRRPDRRRRRQHLPRWAARTRQLVFRGVSLIWTVLLGIELRLRCYWPPVLSVSHLLPRFWFVNIVNTLVPDGGVLLLRSASAAWTFSSTVQISIAAMVCLLVLSLPDFVEMRRRRQGMAEDSSVDWPRHGL